MKIRRSYTVDEKIYEDFLKYAKTNSLNISRWIENCMIKKLDKKEETPEEIQNA